MRLTGVRIGVAVAVAVLATLSSCAVQPLTRDAHDGGVYVALGDSYAAGPGIPDSGGGPPGCGRSTRNYPSLVNDRARYREFRDVSCSGATLADLTTAQATRAGVNPPQLNAVSADADLVTITIGANDIGFGEIVARCLAAAEGRPDLPGCRAAFERDGHDVLADRIAALGPRLERLLTEIRRRAPGATILAVGYPRVLPSLVGGCPEAPFSRTDAAYLRDTVAALNDVIERRAETAGARYVDTASSSAAHDVCRPADLRWIEGTAPTSRAAPFHPNVKGMENAAGQVLSSRILP